jgi:hypothetical protein
MPIAVPGDDSQSTYFDLPCGNPHNPVQTLEILTIPACPVDALLGGLKFAGCAVCDGQANGRGK